MWKRSRAARWFDSPTDSVLCRKKNGLNHNLRRVPRLVFYFLFLSTPLLFVSDKRKAMAKLFVNIFLSVPAMLRQTCGMRLQLAFLKLLSALGLVTAQQQGARPQPNKSRFRLLSDLWNSFPFLQYVLFCLCRPRDELLLLNSIDAELVSSHFFPHLSTVTAAPSLTRFVLLFLYWLLSRLCVCPRLSLHLERKDGMWNWSNLTVFGIAVVLCFPPIRYHNKTGLANYYLSCLYTVTLKMTGIRRLKSCSGCQPQSDF